MPATTDPAKPGARLVITSRISLALAALFLATVVYACGADEPAAQSPVPREERGWWLFEDPDYELVRGELTPPEIAGQTGSLWMLEYSNAGQTVRLVADQAGGLFSELSAASPSLGATTVDRIQVTLRQHPGRPQEGIAPSVGAEWTDGDVFVSFGGPGLSEADLRGLLEHVRRATREEWEAAAVTVVTAEPPVEAP